MARSIARSVLHPLPPPALQCCVQPQHPMCHTRSCVSRQSGSGIVCVRHGYASAIVKRKWLSSRDYLRRARTVAEFDNNAWRS